MKINSIKKKELVRFLVGGGSAVLTDYLVYKILMYMGLERSVSKAISFMAGSAVGFIINKFWTFESKEFYTMEIVRYIILYSCTAFINALVNKVTLMFVSIEIIGFLCATGVSTILNFLGQKFFVFHKQERLK